MNPKKIGENFPGKKNEIFQIHVIRITCFFYQPEAIIIRAEMDINYNEVWIFVSQSNAA